MYSGVLLSRDGDETSIYKLWSCTCTCLNSDMGVKINVGTHCAGAPFVLGEASQSMQNPAEILAAPPAPGCSPVPLMRRARSSCDLSEAGSPRAEAVATSMVALQESEVVSEGDDTPPGLAFVDQTSMVSGECADEPEDMSRLAGSSAEVLIALKQRTSIKHVLAGKKIGRAINGAKSYLSNNKLNETDSHLLRRHLNLAG